MITVENVEVAGIRKAIEGMRHAMNSWGKRDSRMVVMLIEVVVSVLTNL